MKKMMLFLFVVVLAICFGCATGPDGKTTVDQAKVAMVMNGLSNALAIAQVGYMDYMTIAGKTADPRVLGSAQLIDRELSLLGALAYNTAQPTQADLDVANAALAKVAEAKAEIAKRAAEAAAATAQAKK